MTDYHLRYSGCYYIHYSGCPLRHFLLWLQVAHTAHVFTSPSRHGRNKTSYQCIRCRLYCIIPASSIGSVSVTESSWILTFKSYTQLVHIYCNSDVSLRPLCLIMIWMGNSYAKWTPGNPCTFDKLLYQIYVYIIFFSLRYFKLFQWQSGWSYLLWNVFLSVDFTSHSQRFARDARWWPVRLMVLLRSSQPWWNGMSNYQETNFQRFDRWLQPKHPTLSAFGRASTFSLGSIAFGSLIVTLLDLLRLILNAARNNANADGHRESCLSLSMWNRG